MNRWLETDTQKTARNIINVLNESAAGMVKKEINKDKPEEAPKNKKVALEKRITRAAIKGKKPESKNAKMPKKIAKKVVKEELEPETEKSIEDQIADLQDYLNNTPEIAEDEKEAIQAEIDDLISQLGEDEIKDSNLKEDDAETVTFEIDYADDDVDLSTEESVIEDVRNWLGTLANEVKIEVSELSGPAGGWPIVRLTGNKEKIAKFLLDNYNSGAEETLDDVYGLYLQENKLQEASFNDKVSAIKKSLKKRDKRLSDKTAEKSAKNIAGAMAKKESLEQNEEDGWGEDVLEICEPFFEKVERTMYEVRNARRGSYAHFGDTVSDLAAWMGELSTEAEGVQSELDDMKEQLQESDKNKLKEEYSEKFGGDPKDFIGDLISVKYQLSKLNLDGFGSHLARQMVEDFIDTCDRQIKKAKRLASGDEFYTEADDRDKSEENLKTAVDKHNRFNKRGYNFVQYSNSEEDIKILEELNNEPEIVVYDELYSDKNGIDPDSGKNYFDEYGCKIIYISGPLKGPNGPQEYMRYVIYKGTPEQVALFRTGGTGHTLRDAAEVDDICIATPKRLTESDDRTYKDRDEAEYYRNKELYANSNLARHREAMEKAKKACEEKGIKLDEDNYLSLTRKEEPLDLVAYEPEITSIDEVKDKYVKIRGDFHKVIDVKPEGDKFVISFAAGTGTAIGGEFEPATLDEIKRLQLYTENK